MTIGPRQRSGQRTGSAVQGCGVSIVSYGKLIFANGIIGFDLTATPQEIEWKIRSSDFFSI